MSPDARIPAIRRIGGAATAGTSARGCGVCAGCSTCSSEVWACGGVAATPSTCGSGTRSTLAGGADRGGRCSPAGSRRSDCRARLAPVRDRAQGAGSVIPAAGDLDRAGPGRPAATGSCCTPAPSGVPGRAPGDRPRGEPVGRVQGALGRPGGPRPGRPHGPSLGRRCVTGETRSSGLLSGYDPRQASDLSDESNAMLEDPMVNRSDKDLLSIGDVAQATGSRPTPSASGTAATADPSRSGCRSGHRRYTRRDVHSLRKVARRWRRSPPVHGRQGGRRGAGEVPREGPIARNPRTCRGSTWPPTWTGPPLPRERYAGAAVVPSRTSAPRDLRHAATRADGHGSRQPLGRGRTRCPPRALPQRGRRVLPAAARLGIAVSPKAPLMVSTTLEGERHGLGLQMASVMCVVEGGRVHVLGSETPSRRS